MTAGGDNYTRVLSQLALSLENVNVTQRSDDGKLFALSADAKTASQEAIEGLVSVCADTNSTFEIRNGQFLILVKND